MLSLSFEGIEKEGFEEVNSFCQRICRLLYQSSLSQKSNQISDFLQKELEQMVQTRINLFDLSDFISRLCVYADKPVVFIIDEVDQASGQEIFLSFLGMLRNKYLNRDKQPAFQSVILSSVYDIRNLKLKIRPDGEHYYNSPWNIASDFTVDMSFSAADIAGMLNEYEQTCQTGMDRFKIEQMLYEYTSGYPFLVSRLCKLLDERIAEKEEMNRSAAWTKEGIIKAVKMILNESNTLFDDMVKKLNDFPELRHMLYEILFNGKSFPYVLYNRSIYIGSMFGFLKNNEGTVTIANRIFETFLYNLFLSEDLLDSSIYHAASLDKNQ